MDEGAPISYEVLQPGTPVYSSDEQQIGTVAHVLAVEAEDVFDGIVIAEPVGKAHRFADAEVVGPIHERAVHLTIDAAACEQLPRPTANPAVMREDPSEGVYSPLQQKLHRAWDLLSGKY